MQAADRRHGGPHMMQDCCLAVIERYRVLVTKEREGAALYCARCSKRLVLRNGVWGTEP